MQKVGVFFFLPALVILFWLFMFVVKRRPLHKFHWQFMLTLLIYLLALVFCALHFVPGLENNYMLITLFSFCMSLYVPTHYIYIRNLTSSTINPVWCFLNYVPFIILLVGNVFILSSGDNESFEADVVKAVLNNEMDENGACGVGRVARLVRIVNLSVIIQLFGVMSSSALRIRRNIMQIPCYDIDVKQKIDKTPTLYYIQQMVEMTVCSLLTVSLFWETTSSVLVWGVVAILTCIVYKKGKFMYKQTFFKMPEKTKSIEEMLGENPLVFLCLNSDGTLKKEHSALAGECDALENENLNESKDDIEKNDEGQDNSPQPKTGARLSEDIILRVEREKLFLNQELSLNSLADKLYTNRTYLSQSIVYYKKMNFSSWIKSLRIEYAVKIMKETDDKIDISSLATQCGYKNLSSFYHDFQSIMGIAPRQFINSNSKKDVCEELKK